jgi:hypothetical protein
MPHWSPEPPASTEGHAFTIIRTPEHAPLIAVVTSDRLLGCDTHFWGGRTIPCERPTPDQLRAGIQNQCRACLELSPYRWHAYLSAVKAKTHEHIIFEMTARAALAFRDYRATNGTLRGCWFVAERPKKKRTSRIVITCKPFDQTIYRLPDAPDIIRAMSVIWQLPATAIQTISGLDGAPQVALDPYSLAAFHDDPTPPVPQEKSQPSAPIPTPNPAPKTKGLSIWHDA